MKQVLTGFLLAGTILFSGCLKSSDKSCTDRSPQLEESDIMAYASANSINAVKHTSGLYYEIIDPGSGVPPSLSSVVKVTYTGKLLNGQVFDQLNTPPAQGWSLSSLIAGWQIGLPLIAPGGRIKLIIPSSLAYGCRGVSGAIPGNSILFFDVTLVEVQ